MSLDGPQLSVLESVTSAVYLVKNIQEGEFLLQRLMIEISNLCNSMSNYPFHRLPFSFHLTVVFKLLYESDYK